MTKGTHLLRSALLALLGLVVISGASFASGDLFDDDYKDCPYQTRLRDGQIADLSVARDSDDADHVNVSWSATDASGWGLGSNAYNTSLVVILNDGSNNTKTLSLGSRKATFEKVATGKSVKVQMAIVVDHADGDYLISDILEQSIDQSLSKPAFSTGWHRLTSAEDGDTTAAGHQYQSAKIAGGMMYYIGYNENFGNAKEYTGTSTFTTRPSTERLRIGLAHSSVEDDDARDAVKFDAYIIRITDEAGDVVGEADDVATVESSYSSQTDTVNKLFAYNLPDTRPTFHATTGGILTGDPAVDTGEKLYNVRVVNGAIEPAMHTGRLAAPGTIQVQPAGKGSMVKVGVSGTDGFTNTSRVVGDIYANPPDEHRDLPVDTLTTDETFTITAWAINKDKEVISPVASLSVRQFDEVVTLSNENNGGLQDYRNTTAITDGTAVVTQFTVLK